MSLPVRAGLSPRDCFVAALLAMTALYARTSFTLSLRAKRSNPAPDSAIVAASDAEGRMNERVDVLIIGAGASGAAVAWSLAETKMRILCLEQGDWQKSSDFPSTGRDWEARLSEDFAISPNRRALAADYPVNDDDSPIKIANFNGVGGGTILYAGHYPRLHPSDFRVRSLDGVADDWPI